MHVFQTTQTYSQKIEKIKNAHKELSKTNKITINPHPKNPKVNKLKLLHTSTNKERDILNSTIDPHLKVKFFFARC